MGKNDVGKVEGDAELFWCEVLSFLLLLGSHIGLLVLRPVAQDLWNPFFYVFLMFIASRSTYVKFVCDVSSAVDVPL